MQIGIYPNPVVAEFTVKFPESFIGEQFTVSDLSGRTVMQGTILQSEMMLDASALEKGIYQLSINGRSAGRKFVK
jgi:hypothetical protein